MQTWEYSKINVSRTVYANVQQRTLNMKFPTTSQAAVVSVQNCDRQMNRSAKPGFWTLSFDEQKFRFDNFNPYPTAFPYGNGMVLHFYQQQESSTTKTVHKVINKGLKAYV